MKYLSSQVTSASYAGKTQAAGGAFFILGCDPYKTLVAGIARVLALIADVALGPGLFELFGHSLVSDVITIVACGLA